MIDRREIGRRSKRKGNRGEREHADWLTKITGAVWKRTPSSGGFHQDFPFDAFKASSKETVLDGVGNENKNTNTLAVGSWIEQQETACLDYYGNALHREWYVRFAYKGKRYFVIPQEYFEKLLCQKQNQ